MMSVFPKVAMMILLPTDLTLETKKKKNKIKIASLEVDCVRYFIRVKENSLTNAF